MPAKKKRASVRGEERFWPKPRAVRVAIHSGRPQDPVMPLDVQEPPLLRTRGLAGAR